MQVHVHERSAVEQSDCFLGRCCTVEFDGTISFGSSCLGVSREHNTDDGTGAGEVGGYGCFVCLKVAMNKSVYDWQYSERGEQAGICDDPNLHHVAGTHRLLTKTPLASVTTHPLVMFTGGPVRFAAYMG